MLDRGEPADLFFWLVLQWWEHALGTWLQLEVPFPANPFAALRFSDT